MGQQVTIYLKSNFKPSFVEQASELPEFFTSFNELGYSKFFAPADISSSFRISKITVLCTHVLPDRGVNIKTFDCKDVYINHFMSKLW